MERLLFAYAGVGLATGAAALALLALAPFWEKRYAARFRCIVWLALYLFSILGNISKMEQFENVLYSVSK